MVSSDFIAGFAIGVGATAIPLGILLYIFTKRVPDAIEPEWKEK